MDKKTIASMIDHTLLKPEATPAQIEKLCAGSGGVSLCQASASIRFIFRWQRVC